MSSNVAPRYSFSQIFRRGDSRGPDRQLVGVLYLGVFVVAAAIVEVCAFAVVALTLLVTSAFAAAPIAGLLVAITVAIVSALVAFSVCLHV